MNNALNGLHSQPSRSAAGGVALCTDEEFETVWIED